MPPPAGLEPGTAVFKKCTTADETLPCGQKMTKGDFAVALRWLERIPVGRDPQRLTFEDDDTKKPQLVDAASFVRVLDPSAKEITKKAVLKATPERPVRPVVLRAAGRIIKIAALGANNGQSACALGQRNGRRVNRRRQQRDNQGAQQKQGNPQQGDPPPGLH
jgi:hypothetical protein